MPSQSPPAGFVLRDPDGSLPKRITLVVIIMTAVVVVLSLIAGIGWGLFAGLVVGGLALLIGKDAVQAAFAWHPPQLQVASGGYPLGSSPVVTYRRKPKRLTDVGNFAVECELTCEEEATYTHGTDTSTESRYVFRERCDGAGQGTADGLVAEIVLPISAHAGAPSMRLPNNTISWAVTIEVNGQRLPRDSHRFVIDVGPTLDVSYRHRVQDS